MGKHHSTKFGVRIAMSSISAVVELLADEAKGEAKLV
ncbi:hypothetical protein FOPG_19919 [Fusarium oxysporum f. sp. conglutinans race 2 54008]|uniref:Uncharacterized protein n=1 Tax=Fusarium oxysporum f. sp. conglutinans race 2 54008 TaxID=1089457 RepID=X0GKJ5_FUSOX|nr:hypothetical protein FOPG_19919 [Fusarium oxysporum f. sp. conglutinans race 2 54008]